MSLWQKGCRHPCFSSQLRDERGVVEPLHNLLNLEMRNGRVTFFHWQIWGRFQWEAGLMRPTASNRLRYLPRWRKQKMKSWPLFCNRKYYYITPDICYSSICTTVYWVWNVGRISNISLWKHFIQEPCFSLANEKLVGVKYTETEERVYQDLELLMSPKTVLNQEKIL